MGLMVLSKLFTDNKRAVLASRRRNDGKHLEKGATGKCRSSSGFFFQCACEQGSLASKHEPTRGINVLVTVPAAIVKMLTDFMKLVPAHLGFQLYGDIRGRVELVENVKLWGWPQILEWGSNDEFKYRIDAECVLLVTAHCNFCTLLVQPLVQKPHKDEVDQKKEAYYAKKGTPSGITKQAELAEYKQNFKQNLIPFHIGRVVADECHTYLTMNHGLLKHLHDTPDRIRIIPQTGTQTSNAGLKPVQCWLEITWKQSRFVFEDDKAKTAHPLNPDKVNKLNLAYSNAIKKNGDRSDLGTSISSLYTIMDKCNMIRRDNFTTWLDGQSVIICPPIDTQTYHLPFNRRKHWNDYVKLTRRAYRKMNYDLREQEEKTGEAVQMTLNKFGGAAKKILLSATFPGAATDFLSEDPRFDGNRLEAPLAQWSDIATELAHSSTKFAHFNKELMPRWEKEHQLELASDPEARIGKVLIFTHHPFTAAIFYLALEQKYGEGAAHAYLDTTTSKTKDRLAKMFDTDKDKIGSLGVQGLEDIKKARFLCSTYGIAATAIDLRACTKVVLLEPSHQQKNEEQAICRAARTGQDRSVEVIRYTATEEEKVLASRNNTVRRLMDLAARWTEQRGSVMEESLDLAEEEDDDGPYIDEEQTTTGTVKELVDGATRWTGQRKSAIEESSYLKKEEGDI